MIPPRRLLLTEFLKLVDLLVMIASFGLAFWVATGQLARAEFIARHVTKIESVTKAVALMIVWHLIYTFFNLYGSRRLLSRWQEAKDVIKASLLGSLVIYMAGSALVVTQVDTEVFFGVFSVVCTTSTIATRLALRYLLEQARRRGRNLRNILMVGTNVRAREFAESIESRPQLGYKVMGFVDEEWHGLEEALRQIGGGLVANFDSLSDYLRSNQVDEVIVALPFSTSYRESTRIVSLCEEQGITVRFVSQFFDLRLAKAKVEMFQGTPVLTLQISSIEGGQETVKRLVDHVVSFVLLILLLPLFLAVSALIKLTSRGPVFFAQERVGLNKRRFRLYKFRTMVPDAEARLAEIEHLNEVAGPVFKIRNDPRITRLGRFLRRTSIDELPQLWNVFRGDMSLVGPRPLPLRDVAGFDQDKYRRRFSVRPGITCLWQVLGRSSIPFEEWMELDLKYIDEWSLWLDFQILFQTIPVVFKPLVFEHAGGEFPPPPKRKLREILNMPARGAEAAADELPGEPLIRPRQAAGK